MRPERLILIHGAWAGPWIWEALIHALAARGWRAEALAIPGDGTHPIPPDAATEADILAALSQAVEAGPGPVVLIGHSGGGMLVTAGADAHPLRVSHGIWIAGMLIPDGRSFDDIQEDMVGPGRRFGVTPHIVPSKDGRLSTVPRDAAITHFFQDLDAVEADQAAARLTPQPMAGHRMRTRTGEAFARLPKLYVIASEDRSVLPEAQHAMAQSSATVTVKQMQSGHCPQISQPDALAELLADWFDAGTRDLA